MRIADFASKLGKVVDRRGSLTKALQASGHTPQIAAALACRLPRDQIAAHQSELRAHNVILITGEDLTAMLARVRFPSEPDRLLADAIARMSTTAE